MTEQQDNQIAETAVPGAQLNADGPNGAPEGNGTGEAGNGSQRQNREARYRVERNEARAERDELAQRVETLLTREAERVAAQHLAEPADLFTLGGVTVRDLLDERGDIDPEKVDAVATQILGTRPGLSRLAPATDPSQGHGGTPEPKTELSWGALLTDD
jgi:hypothetical protein